MTHDEVGAIERVLDNAVTGSEFVNDDAFARGVRHTTATVRALLAALSTEGAQDGTDGTLVVALPTSATAVALPYDRVFHLALIDAAIAHNAPGRARIAVCDAYLHLTDAVDGILAAMYAGVETVEPATPKADATTEGSGVSSVPSPGTEADNSALIAVARRFIREDRDPKRTFRTINDVLRDLIAALSGEPT